MTSYDFDHLSSVERQAHVYKIIQRYQTLLLAEQQELSNSRKAKLRQLQDDCLEELWMLIRPNMLNLAARWWGSAGSEHANADDPLESLALSLYYFVYEVVSKIRLDQIEPSRIISYLVACADNGMKTEYVLFHKGGLTNVGRDGKPTFLPFDTLSEYSKPDEAHDLIELITIPSTWQKVLEFWKREFTEDVYSLIIQKRYLEVPYMKLEDIAILLDMKPGTIRKRHKVIRDRTTYFILSGLL